MGVTHTKKNNNASYGGNIKKYSTKLIQYKQFEHNQKRKNMNWKHIRLIAMSILKSSHVS